MDLNAAKDVVEMLQEIAKRNPPDLVILKNAVTNAASTGRPLDLTQVFELAAVLYMIDDAICQGAVINKERRN